MEIISHIIPDDPQRLRILIAEDDDVTSKLLEVMVEHLGHKAILAANGAEAWEIFQKFNPQIVLTDWNMPSMDGLQLCKKIRELEKPDYNYVVVLTAAFTSKENYQQAMAAGADDFLRKPYDRDELAAKLRVAERIIKFHSTVRELRQLIPICSYCKSIRSDKNYWEEIGNYLASQAGLHVTHGICPDCADKHFKSILEEKKQGAVG